METPENEASTEAADKPTAPPVDASTPVIISIAIGDLEKIVNILGELPGKHRMQNIADNMALQAQSQMQSLALKHANEQIEAQRPKTRQERRATVRKAAPKKTATIPVAKAPKA